VVDFASLYNKYRQPSAEDQPKPGEDQPKPGAEPLFPWKYYSAKLIEALEGMKARSPKDPQVVGAVDQSLKVLSKIEKASAVAPNPFDELQPWLLANPPAGKSLYKGDESAAVTFKPAFRKDDEKPEDKKPDKPEEKKDK
jgi:hypothetical protein